MKLRTKFISGFLGVASLATFLGAINLRFDHIAHQKFNHITDITAPSILELDRIKEYALRLKSSSQVSIIARSNPNDSQINLIAGEIEKQQQNLERALSEYKSLAEADEQEFVRGMEQSKAALDEIVLELRDGLGQNDNVQEKLAATIEQLLVQIERALAEEVEELQEGDETVEWSAINLIINLFCFTFLVLLATSLGFFYSRIIANPIIKLKEASAKIGRGEFGAKVELNSQDEIGILADQFNQIVEKLEEANFSRTYLDNIISSLGDGIIVLDKEIVIQSFNNATLFLTGYEEDELRFQPLKVFLNQEELDFLEQGWTNESRQNSFMGRKETTLLTKDGRQIPVSVAASVMENTEGEIDGIVCLVQDISARKIAEEALCRQALMFETISDGIIITDFEGRIIDWNPAAERMFGYDRAEALDKTPGMLYRPEETDLLTQQMLDGLRCEGLWAGEINFIHKDGSEGFCETVIVPLLNENNQLTATIGVNRDITERKQYENELVAAREAALEAARLKSEFIANMSHEIRTPMNGVLGMSELLLTTTKLNPQQLEFVQTLKASGDHLMTVINDILDFSKLEAGAMELNREELDLNGCLEKVLDLSTPQATIKGLALGLLVDSEVPRQLMGDGGRLRQILANLVGNAIKFTEVGEVAVHVSVSSQNDKKQKTKLRFAVKDTGIGIAKEDQKRLFQSFSQVDGSTTRKYGGTGLGLAICKQLVELMGGKIGVDSQPGVGSTFWFTAIFDKIAPATTKIAIPQVSTHVGNSYEALRGKKLLVVDDHSINRQVVQHQLTGWEMEVDEAANGAVALTAMQTAAAAGKPYDVALLDMEMPKIDGATLGKLILAEPAWAHTKLILMTSLYEGEQAEKLLSSGFSDYLVKPVKESRLLRSLLKVLAAQSLSSEDSLPGKAPLIPDKGQGTNLKILLVEDTPMNRQLALHQLQQLGYQADGVENGQAALDKLAECNYDIVLMDCQMPVMDGYQATEILRQRERVDQYTVVIGMTAYAMEGDREKCLAAGMDDYLSKPVALKDLEAAIQRWLPLVQGDWEGESSQFQREISIYLAPDLIDWPYLENISGGDISFQMKLLQTFVKDGEVYLLQAKQALEANDCVALAHKAHQIQGGSASVAVQSMSEIARQLCDRAKANNLEGASELIASLEQILGRLKGLV
ncbi:MAG: response regulator [Xenococcaceae cyanobacterium]